MPERVVVRDEGPRGGAARDRVQGRRLDFEVALLLQAAPDRAQDRAALLEHARARPRWPTGRRSAGGSAAPCPPGRATSRAARDGLRQQRDLGRPERRLALLRVARARRATPTRSPPSSSLRRGHQLSSLSRCSPTWMRPVRSCSGKKISLPKSRKLSMRPASVTLSPTSGPGADPVPRPAQQLADRARRDAARGKGVEAQLAQLLQLGDAVGVGDLGHGRGG